MTYFSEKIQEVHQSRRLKPYLTQQVILGKQFIDQHYAENISLNEITRAAYLSKFHFIRIFKNHYGRTPRQYLRDVRIAEAKKLLTKGLSISEACYTVGFSSIPSFSALFKQITGFTPAFYQVMEKAKKSNFQ